MSRRLKDKNNYIIRLYNFSVISLKYAEVIVIPVVKIMKWL